MVTINLQQTTLDLAVSEAQRDRVIVTQNGKPVAIIIGVAGMDEEQLQLSTSDQFWKLITERRGQKTINRAELERRLDSRAAQQPTLIPTMTPAIAEPKPDYETGND